MFAGTCARWPVQLAPSWGNGSETSQHKCSGRRMNRSLAWPATASRGCGASAPRSGGSAPMCRASAPMCGSTEADLAMRCAGQQDRTVRANRRPDALRPASCAGACSREAPRCPCDHCSGRHAAGVAPRSTGRSPQLCVPASAQTNSSPSSAAVGCNAPMGPAGYKRASASRLFPT